jgi:outer membrane protein TolC
MKKSLISGALLVFMSVAAAKAQNTRLTLSECYSLAEQNYPLSKQRDLISKTADYTVENLQKGNLPQLSFNGQATYQSAVTEVPIKLPGVNISSPSKDQYKLYGEVNQVIYDGGAISGQKELQKTNAAIEQQRLEAELFQLKNRVNQLFFGILLIDEQLKQNDLLVKDLELGLAKVQAAINNGIAFKSNADVVNADLLKIKQRNIEMRAGRKAYADMLALFIGREIPENVDVVKPQPISISQQINRPELLVYERQNASLNVQNKLLIAKTLPKFGFFFQGGLGRPALNMLSNKFDAYYIGGLRLSWSPSVFYTLKNERALIDINRSSLEVQKETFLFNTNLVVRQQNADIKKYIDLLASDDEIIALREKVKKTSVAQLENGVINGNDYLREANAEDQARQTKILHEIQLLISQYSQQTTTGNL